MPVLLDVPILFDVPGGITHAPMVEATVGGVVIRLILDTGSTDHVFTVDLAERAGLPTRHGEPGTDHAGASVDSWAIGDVSVAIADQDFDLHDVVAIAGPPPFTGWGIGGFLSPQHLHPAADVLIDLVDDRFSLIVGEADPVLAYAAERHPILADLVLARSAAAPTPVVQAGIDPYPAVPTMLNTGGRATEFAAWAVPGLTGAPDDDLGHGVGGAPVQGTSIADRTLVVAGRRQGLKRLLIRPEIEGLGGLIGMDVLRGTVLSVAADRGRPIHWLVPDRRP